MTVENKWLKENKKIILKGLTVVLVLCFVKYILTLVMPFFIALCLVSAVQPVLEWIERKLPLKKRTIGIWILLLVGVLTVMGFWYFVTALCGQMGQLVSRVELCEEGICRAIHSGCELAGRHLGVNADAMENTIFFHINNVTEEIKRKAVPRLMNYSVVYVKIFFSVLGFLAMTVIAAVLLAKDYTSSRADLRKHSWYRTTESIGCEIGYLAIRYGKAQLTIMGIIGILSGVLLWIMKIENGFMIGIMTGLLDALPFIGTGIVLLPIAFWQLIQGEVWKSVGVAGLYIFCVLLREFLEPKFIGKEMDVYPVVILLSIYVGIRLYGLGGVILGPLSVLVIREIWKRIPDSYTNPFPDFYSKD